MDESGVFWVRELRLKTTLKKNIVLNMDLEILWNDSGTVMLGKYL